MNRDYKTPAGAAPPDWRGLCEELVEALNGWHKAVFETGVGWVRPDETYLLDRARAVLARFGHQPAPPAEGEVAELVAKLRRLAPHNPLGTADPTITRAADLLEQRHPAPVPVAERLPGAGDCDEKGSCWLWTADDVDGVGHWSYSHRDWAQEGDVTHWLPATALPLPQGEVE